MDTTKAKKASSESEIEEAGHRQQTESTVSALAHDHLHKRVSDSKAAGSERAFSLPSGKRGVKGIDSFACLVLM